MVAYDRVLAFTWGAPTNPAHYAAAKLTPAQRDEIGFRRMEGEQVSALAAEYDVAVETIRKCAPKERG